MEPPLLEIRGLTKAYGDKTVLDGLDLVVARGETVVVLGGSGSGKSTLARLLVGLEAPTAGHIFVAGRDLVEMNEHDLARERQRFAMVFQKYALLDSLSVYDNVAFPLRERRHLSEAEIRTRVMAQLDALGVADAAKKLPGELSGGMAKRVGIARAMVMDPEILVYDEPTSGLDPVTSRVVDGLVEEVRERFCVTSIVITHDMATAWAIADRVVLLHGGKIAIDGPPDVVLASRDPRIETFAGSSGVDPARLARRAHRLAPAQIRERWATRRRAAISPHESGKGIADAVTRSSRRRQTMGTKITAKGLEKDLDELLDELEGLGEEIELKVKLASMDMRDTWRNKLEPKLFEARIHAKDAKDEAKKALKDTIKAFKEFSSVL